MRDVQCDEIWGFIEMKQKTKHLRGRENDKTIGDAYCFIGIERDSKLILAWHLGQRTEADTIAFTEKLAHATEGNFQITTDGFKPYQHAVVLSLGAQHVDFAQLVKLYTADRDGEALYSPAECTGGKKVPIFGNLQYEQGFNVSHRETESHGSDAHEKNDPPHQWILKEVGESQGRICTLLRALQLLPRSLFTKSYPGNGSRIDRPHLDTSRTTGRLIA